TNACSANVMASRPTNKNNYLRDALPAKTVRTEICTEIFWVLVLYSTGGRNSPCWRRPLGGMLAVD
ncbi:MAG: hypothetical protein ABSF86_22545, partial [Steroidobacteraceae bacterium]